jgi:hypothetical protein
MLFFISCLLCGLLSCAGAASFELGLNVHTEGLPGLARAKNLGASWVRIDMNWDGIEPSPGRWDFSAPDRSVDAAESLGLKVYATLAYAPAWARKGSESSAVPDPGAWKNFVLQVASRYCGRIDAYGVWNEPNLEEFWQGSAEQYVEILLKPAWQAIKSEDPSALVAGPELAQLYSARLGIADFFEALQSLGGGAFLDVVSHHLYATDEFPQKIFGYYAGDLRYREGLLPMLEAAGLGAKPVWITEFGADSRASGEDGQARLLLEQARLLKSLPWIRKAFIFQLRDDSGPGPQWGLLRPDGSLKPAFYDLRSLVRNEF